MDLATVLLNKRFRTTCRLRLQVHEKLEDGGMPFRALTFGHFLRVITQRKYHPSPCEFDVINPSRQRLPLMRRQQWLVGVFLTKKSQIPYLPRTVPDEDKGT